jgi:hypothetical protein
MNSEMYTLVWYTRSELVSIRRKVMPFGQDKRVIMTDSEDELSMRKEVDDIIRDVTQTLDDIIQTEMLLMTTMFLSHIIQSLTVHISKLSALLKEATSKNFIFFPLDINCVRLICFIKTLLVVARANLAILCTSTPKSSVIPESPTNKNKFFIPAMYQQKRPPAVLVRSCSWSERRTASKSSACSKPHVPSKLLASGSSDKTDEYLTRNLLVSEPNYIPPPTIPPAFQRSLSNRRPSRLFVQDQIEEVSRLSKKLCSRDMLDSHAQGKKAMIESLDETEKSEPDAKMKWRSANSIIRTLVKLRTKGK